MKRHGGNLTANYSVKAVSLLVYGSNFITSGVQKKKKYLWRQQMNPRCWMEELTWKIPALRRRQRIRGRRQAWATQCVWNKRVVISEGLRDGKDGWAECRGLLGPWSCCVGLKWEIHVVFGFPTHRIYSKNAVKGNSRMWTIILCHCGFISFKKCAGLVGEADATEAVEWGEGEETMRLMPLKPSSEGMAEAGTTGDICVPFAQFSCESKAAFKNHLAFKR